jgi:hypothetical protein
LRSLANPVVSYRSETAGVVRRLWNHAPIRLPVTNRDWSELDVLVRDLGAVIAARHRLTEAGTAEEGAMARAVSAAGLVLSRALRAPGDAAAIVEARIAIELALCVVHEADSAIAHLVTCQERSREDARTLVASARRS